MKRQQLGPRATPFWLVMGLFAGAGCGGVASPPPEDTRTPTQSRSSALQVGPDLVVTEVSAPRSVRHGQPFTATVKVCNQGADPATTYYSWPWLELYLSMDASLSMPGGGSPPPTDQRLIGSVDVPPLDPGQCVTRDVNAHAFVPPDAQGDGAYYLGAIVDAHQMLSEADETNNAYVAGLMGVGFRPDLVVTEVRGPTSVRPGDAFTATLTVCNQGTEFTSNTPSVDLYLSMDDSLTPLPTDPGTPPPTDQRMIGSVQLSPLGAGQCVTRSVQAHASLPPDAQGDGAFYLGAVVDPFRVEPELREDNNITVPGRMGVGHRSDLVVTEVRGPTSVQHGNAFTATVTVCNQGTEFVGNTPSVELYLSTDDDLTPLPTDPGTPPPTDQRVIGTVSLPPLGPGQCVTRNTQAWAWLPPDAQGDGAYYLGAIVDSFGVELELREDNNARVAGLMGVGYRPDLVVTEVRGPASARPGDPFTATVTVCNQGTVSTPSWYSQTHVDLYLSTDTTLTPPSTSGPSTPPMDQRMVGTVQLPPLNAGQCVTRSVNAHAQPPQDPLPRQAYYLGAIVDPFQSEPELREDNNITVGDLMGVGYRSDLVVTEVTAPASVLGGQHFTATVRVCNRGTESTGWYGQSYVELYLSMDTMLTAPNPMGPSTSPTDQRMIGSAPVPPLSAGQCVSQSVNVSAYPPPDALGDDMAFHLGVIVDPHQSELELREDNNTFIGGLLGVGHRPDLVVTQLSGPASVRGGESFTATVTVCNQGTESTGWYGGPHVALYMSMDTALTSHGSSGPGMPMPTDQRMVGAVDLPPLHPGQCATRSVTAYAQPPPDATVESAFYLGAIVDSFQSLSELREDNNTFIRGLMGLGSRPDLVVTEVSGPASVRPGDAFTATVRVCNQGTEPTSWYGQTQVDLYLSTDTTLTMPNPMGPSMPPTDQRMIGTVQLPSLNAGQCVTRSVNAYAQPPPEATMESALYLGAIMDPFHNEQELREDNNTFVGGLLGMGYRSDLVVTQVTGPASMRPGDAFTATVRVCNQGTEPTSWYGQTQVDLYLSTDTTLTPPPLSGPSTPPTDQRMIGTVQLPPLSAGQCVNQRVNAHAQPPQDPLPRQVYYLGAIVDPFRNEPELREDNNITVGDLMGVGYHPDLVVTALSGPASVRDGNPFTATVTVCNQGTEPITGWYGPPRVELYLSMDTTLTSPLMSGPSMPPTDQRLIGTVELAPLGAGQCVTRSANVHAYLPPDSGGNPGPYYLGAIVDPHLNEQELREDNNTFVGGLLGVGLRSDLVVTQVTGPASVRPGDAFSTTVTVCNQGTEPTGGYGQTQVELYLSTDTTLTAPNPMGPSTPPMDQRMIGAFSVSPLQAGQCVTQDVNVHAHLPPEANGNEGAYYLGAIVDPFQNEQELREDNNTFVGGLLGVGYRSDLVVTQVSGPASVRPGDAFTASVTVCNQGTEPTSGYGQTQVELYLSTTSALVFPGPGLPPSSLVEQRMIGGAPLTPLMAGQCATLSVPASAHVPPAAYDVRAFHLGAIVDAYRSEQELREDNNVTVAGMVGVGYQSDLVVTEVSGPTSVRRGMPFTASVKVCNQGTEPGASYGNVLVELYFSTDTTLTPPGPMAPPPLDQSAVGSVLVPPLAPGQCETLSVQAAGNPPPEAPWDGAVYLGAIVDAYRSEEELRENNNSTVAGLMGVGDRADLVVTQVSAPATVREGDPFTAAVTVCNQGTEPVNSYGAPILELYTSMDTTLTPPVSSGPWTPMPMDQRMVGSVQVSPLAAGQCETLNVQAWGYRPPAAQGAGSFFLGAIVDAHQSLLELREDNNARADASLELTW